MYELPKLLPLQSHLEACITKLLPTAAWSNIDALKLGRDVSTCIQAIKSLYLYRHFGAIIHINVK